MFQRIRRRLSFIEVVVLGSITLMLAVLLMPALNWARQSSQRTLCANRMRDTGLAMMQYDDTRQKLPGWVNLVCPDVESATAPRDGQNPFGSWAYELLPYLEQADLHYRYGPDNTDRSPTSLRCFGGGMRMPQQTLPGLICPADKVALSESAGLSYVVNCGMKDRNWLSTDIGGGEYGAHHMDLYQEPVANGVFHNNFFRGRLVAGEMVPYRYTTSSLDDVRAADGTATTLMLSENVDATVWHGGRTATDTWGATEGALCFCWSAADPAIVARDPYNGMQINMDLGKWPYRAPRPSGHHGTGVNVVFCDGHTAFISQEVDWMTWTLLHTPNGRGLMEPYSNGYQENIMLGPFRQTRLTTRF